MEYNFSAIESKWQSIWAKNKVYKVDIQKDKKKFYVLDMFPYPSGAGLHVGHPLGYIASDIYSRYKRAQGYNVLHPMGYDAFGLPAEQYAIQTGQHPAVTTSKNIARYREQLDKIGFSYDWDREVRTCEPSYYKWTQWVFVRLFNHYFDVKLQKALPIEQLIKQFEQMGSQNNTAYGAENTVFTATEWMEMSELTKSEVLFNFRIAYLANTYVNWCPKLGTVLANDEVKDGLSLRGGYPVEQRLMKQWSLRVSAYAQRLLDGLDNVDWTDSLKEMQRNWIGRSEGAEMVFEIECSSIKLKIFTTRPDTLWGVTFMVLAPESEWTSLLTTAEHAAEVNAYVLQTKKKTERDRMSEVKKTGVFTGSYALNPFSGDKIPVFVSDYVLTGYGTGAIMAVPAHDQRDYDFAKAFKLPIKQVIDGGDISEQAFDNKDANVINSGFISGKSVKDAIKIMIKAIEDKGIGQGRVNFRIRDAIFSRQRYWGEPFPVYYKDGLALMLADKDLPLELPPIDKFLPTETGEPPLGRAHNWHTKDGFVYDLNTMPGFAGSSAYYLRYMDPSNDQSLVSKEANEYWRSVDLYIGGTEHATGHLIYSRFWNKFLFDLGLVCEDEPFKKLINQGMIQGRSNFVYRIKDSTKFVSYNLRNSFEVTPIHVDVNIVENDILDTEAFKKWNPEYAQAEFILEDGKYICGWAVEKMSKSMFNVVNPDFIVDRYGADTLRLYEMFLGPLEQSKPWDTKGIDGVNRFLKKYWRMFFNADGEFRLSNEAPSSAELKALHKTIKKISDDIERFSFNTAISSFMICLNELIDLNCTKKDILVPFTILLSPFAPHICEEIWHLAGNSNSIVDAVYPIANPSHLVDDVFSYPVSFNGKKRFEIEFPAAWTAAEIEPAIRSNDQTLKYVEGKEIKKIIVVQGRIVNVVL